MSQEKSFSDWISSVITLIKWTIIAAIAWFVIAGGWCGVYYWMKEQVDMTSADEERAERFGNKVFLIWLVVTVVAAHWLYDSPTQEIYDEFFNIFLIIQGIFMTISLAGLSYLMKKTL